MLTAVTASVNKKIAGNFNSKPLVTEQIDQNFKVILGIQGS